MGGWGGDVVRRGRRLGGAQAEMDEIWGRVGANKGCGWGDGGEVGWRLSKREMETVVLEEQLRGFQHHRLVRSVSRTLRKANRAMCVLCCGAACGVLCRCYVHAHMLPCTETLRRSVCRCTRCRPVPPQRKTTQHGTAECDMQSARRLGIPSCLLQRAALPNATSAATTQPLLYPIIWGSRRTSASTPLGGRCSPPRPMPGKSAEWPTADPFLIPTGLCIVTRAKLFAWNHSTA